MAAFRILSSSFKPRMVSAGTTVQVGLAKFADTPNRFDTETRWKISAAGQRGAQPLRVAGSENVYVAVDRDASIAANKESINAFWSTRASRAVDRLDILRHAVNRLLGR